MLTLAGRICSTLEFCHGSAYRTLVAGQYTHLRWCEYASDHKCDHHSSGGSGDVPPEESLGGNSPRIRMIMHRTPPLDELLRTSPVSLSDN
ncbi:Uncharacterised protein [Mycobacteroides abscessus subsp. abscessus]|nr:Uncharacterised protein [Mycobacteroides abscessus subsp. abscessus]